MSREDFKIKMGNGEEVTLTVRKPQYEDFSESDKVYAAKVASLIKEGIGGRKKLLLRSELSDYLKEAGVWTVADEERTEKLQSEVAELLDKMRKGGSKLSEGRKWALEIGDKRREIVKLNQKRQIFDDTTIEAIAENEKIDYLIFVCTVYGEDGRNYWDSFGDMKNDKAGEVYRKASEFGMKVIFNIDSKFENNLPENRWLKKYNFIDDNLNFTDRKTGEKVDRLGRPVKDLEKEYKKLVDNLQGEIEEEAPFVDDEAESVLA